MPRNKTPDVEPVVQVIAEVSPLATALRHAIEDETLTQQLSTLADTLLALGTLVNVRPDFWAHYHHLAELLRGMVEGDPPQAATRTAVSDAIAAQHPRAVVAMLSVGGLLSFLLVHLELQVEPAQRPLVEETLEELALFAADGMATVMTYGAGPHLPEVTVH